MKLLALAILFGTISFSALAQTDQDSTEIVCFFPPPPEFPGGMDSLVNFIKVNSQWVPGQATIEGTVFVQFVVNEDGSTSDAKVIKGLCESCDKEAVRLIKILPKWKPVVVGGKPVKYRMVYPIKFKI